MNTFIPKIKVRIIFQLLMTDDLNIRSTAKVLKCARNTVKKYREKILSTISQHPCLKDDFELFYEQLMLPVCKIYPERVKYVRTLFEKMLLNIQYKESSVIKEWQAYREQYADGYSRSQFILHFKNWCNDNGHIYSKAHCKIPYIPEDDLLILRKWQRSSDRTKWQKATIIFDANLKESVSSICEKRHINKKKVNKIISNYKERGLDGIATQSRKTNDKIKQRMECKRINLIKLLHEAPKIHGINRTSWSLKTLSQVYEKEYREKFSRASIGEYIKKEGYSFRRARRILTSPDPLFREKLNTIKNILSNLTTKQKFFSVDEYGPFAVKMKGGRSYMKKGTQKTFPQLQRSKGCLICTAALELSENQVTHFYSAKKNTEEMIRLLQVLLDKYKDQEKLYFSWDAASWHASKKLYSRIKEINSQDHRSKNNTPIVELAPLPASAQFLNVIESVFSGMAKSVIHNSNYASADECKTAIDLYFKERNKFFLENPHRAGKKIWGKESVIPVFDDTKNCKKWG